MVTVIRQWGRHVPAMYTLYPGPCTHAPGSAAASIVPARRCLQVRPQWSTSSPGADGLAGWAGLGGIVFQLTLLNLPPGAAPYKYQDGMSAPAVVKLQASMLLLALHRAARPGRQRRHPPPNRTRPAKPEMCISAALCELMWCVGVGTCAKGDASHRFFLLAALVRLANPARSQTGPRVGVTGFRQVRVRKRVQALYMCLQLPAFPLSSTIGPAIDPFPGSPLSPPLLA